MDEWKNFFNSGWGSSMDPFSSREEACYSFLTTVPHIRRSGILVQSSWSFFHQTLPAYFNPVIRGISRTWQRSPAWEFSGDSCRHRQWCDRLRQKSWCPSSVSCVAARKNVRLSVLGARPGYSLVVDKDFKKNKQPNKYRQWWGQLTLFSWEWLYRCKVLLSNAFHFVEWALFKDIGSV